MQNYASLPKSAVLSLGGFTGYIPREWQSFLRSTIMKNHPVYALRHIFSRRDASWKMNDCIQEALSKYLLSEFGLLLPGETIFKVYNEAGKGIQPRNIIKAISAVIEPLGIEIERIIVPNDGLRAAMGYREKMESLSGAELFDRRAGLCMINIEQGYSHAFFWQRMDIRKFSSEKFRMAVLLRRKDGCLPSFSALEGLEEFSVMVRAYLFERNAHAEAVKLCSEVDGLVDYAHKNQNEDCDAFRSDFDGRLAEVLNHLSVFIKDHPRPAKPNRILLAGEMIRNIFREALTIQ